MLTITSVQVTIVVGENHDLKMAVSNFHEIVFMGL